mmetsp:Transcript_16959/g.46514  ORF Transcript_16959/g.46514 Transcript_16959/m.46514 type:complete len:97 (+) Transcript_16959:1249-1539(+)
MQPMPEHSKSPQLQLWAEKGDRREFLDTDCMTADAGIRENPKLFPNAQDHKLTGKCIRCYQDATSDSAAPARCIYLFPRLGFCVWKEISIRSKCLL